MNVYLCSNHYSQWPFSIFTFNFIFKRGNYEEIRKSLAIIDWNDKMNNKTATECWNIFRGELDRAIDIVMFL